MVYTNRSCSLAKVWLALIWAMMANAGVKYAKEPPWIMGSRSPMVVWSSVMSPVRGAHNFLLHSEGFGTLCADVSLFRRANDDGYTGVTDLDP